MCDKQCNVKSFQQAVIQDMCDEVRTLRQYNDNLNADIKYYKDLVSNLEAEINLLHTALEELKDE